MIKTQSNRAAQQRFRDLCKAANEQAFEFSSGHIDPWKERVSWRKKAIWSAFAIGCAAAIAGIATERSTGSPSDRRVSAPNAELPMTTRSIDPQSGRSADPVPVQPVRWVEKELLVDIEQVALADASRQLAKATGTTLIGAESLPPTLVVTLHARFGDIPAAWHRLLQGEVLYSVDCSGTGACHVAIAGPVQVHPVLEQGLRTPPLPELPAPPLKNQLPGEAESQPDGAC